MMTLAIDIGNSNIVIAMHRQGQWANTFRYETKATQPEFYYENALRNIFLEWGISGDLIGYTVISSVVPDLNESIRQAVFRVIGSEPLFITPEVIKALNMPVPYPYEIGSDLVANAYAATTSYHRCVIVVDFGTALTFTAVHPIRGIIGVTIAPGIQTAIHSLSANTAQLPVVPVELPDSTIGYDTVSAIQAGVMWGYVGLVKEILQRMNHELGEEYIVIATGGLSSILHPLEDSFFAVNKMLTLDGMRMIGEYFYNSNHIKDVIK